MRIVVTGREGQVVRSLAERGDDIVPLGRPDLDLVAEPDVIVAAIEAVRPDVIVNAAAYTAVDKAESERDLAFAINERGAGAVARAANRLGVPLIHLSTDYVFSGDKPEPYVESDPTGPTGVYGASKLAGERAVLDAHDNAAVLRTAWVYSPFGGNFVKTMLRLARERDELGIVADQRGNPTSALDIADGVLAVAANLARSDDPALRGTFHMTAGGEATWAEFAEEIFAQSARSGGPSATVNRIATADYPTPARRPANSRLDCSRLREMHGVALPDWRQSTAAVVSRLLEPEPAIQGR
ncbi:dTDP-4-dehydrorhamnose reductase [Sphingomonas sabuli]|uniref:dTDP-4-dehydrorhamnose reductase n=1 Tax=Sphingomonas sabuli TaxID=2764186 RepID=A0A7G9L5B0_9SPHN|nr:dTDP-4-dehydrorhamnose reductase [Sphingomonas sabuli]QNM83809.1 dTDP-4-dehydrorhamnose reductase [Sphingomonas sabuli]